LRRPRLLHVAVAAGGVATAFVLAACVDLFHDTSFKTLCDEDASAPGCGAVDGGPTKDVQVAAEAGPDAAATDFCALGATEARTLAAHACAWLGACEGPYEHNTFGQCVFEAIQAYDCTARPNMKVKGSIFTYWSCLANVKSCDDVNRCVAAPGCNGSGVSFNACAPNGTTRVACSATTPKSAHPAFVANCDAQGRRCIQPDINDSIAFCAASDTSGDAGCNAGCQGSVIHDCEDAGLPYAVDLGRDCKNIGAGTCTTADSGAGVCAPAGVACPNGGFVCSANVAIDCRSGVEDRVDCTKLGGTCQASGMPGPAWDPAYACVQGAGTCGADTCSGTTINGCANGIDFHVDCKAVGLSSCAASQPVPVGPDYDPTEVRAACKP
jgi:hypothetical protein